MKPALFRTNFFVLLLFLVTNLRSQVTINSTHMPQIGDTLRFSTGVIDTTVIRSFTDTGANRTWNYTNLVPLRQGMIEYFNSGQTPYPVNGKIAEKVADTLNLLGVALYDVYDFYSNTTNAYSLNQRGFSVPTGLGFPFPPIARFSPTFSNPDEVYEFPLNYQDRDSNAFNFTFNNILPPAYLSSVGYRINEVEAWGVMNTPFGSFNCIKVKTDIISYDTVSFGALAIGDTVHSREYKWLSTQERIPIVSLSGNVVNGNFFPTALEYRDSARNVPNILSPIALFNANPTNVGIGDTVRFNNLTISVLSSSYSWSISPSTFNYVSGTNSNSEEPVVIFTDTGNYDVQLIANNGQGSDTLLLNNYINVSQTVSIQELSDHEPEFNISPNPIQKGNILSIYGSENIDRLLLFDVNMKMIEDLKLTESGTVKFPIDPSLNSGTYFLMVLTRKSFTTKKLIIR